MHIGALIIHDQVWTIKITTHAMLTGTNVIALAIVKSKAVTIDGSIAFDGNTLCIGGIYKNNITVAGGHSFAGCIIFAFGASQ